jgi:hypothetical protein
MKKTTKQLIGIVRNYEEEALFLYFKDGTMYRLDCDLNQTTDQEAINYYSKYGNILERDIKIKNAVRRMKEI